MINSLYPCFQHWSKKGSVYIISDTHFDDEDRELMGYTFNEETQINTLKKVCSINDTLIHLGDVGNLEYLAELKCYKVLIMGNHDNSIEKCKKYFNEVYSGPLWISQKLVLSHEPIDIRLEENAEQIVFNIHGHNHHDEYISDYHLNLTPNNFGYIPLNLKSFIKDGNLKSISSIHEETILIAKQNKALKKYLIKERDKNENDC